MKEAVHYWHRSMGKTRCLRGFVRDRSPAGQLVRVRVLNAGLAYVVTVVASRLKPGWNSWVDPEGRPFEPEGTWNEDGMYSPPIKEKV